MTKEIWLNLPVKNVLASKKFFESIGFDFNHQQETPNSACMLVGKNNFVVMLFQESVFKSFARAEINDNWKNTQMLISIDAENRIEVDALAQKVADAGGTIFAPPSESQGWMYGFGFLDLDGHRWNVLHMDMSKINHHQ